MRKIPTIFVRDMSNMALVTSIWAPECDWVKDGEGRATAKLDGTSCLLRDGILYKRHTLKGGGIDRPDGFETVDIDANGKRVGWVPVGNGTEDQWHREALAQAKGELPDGTYELMGPKVQGNRHNLHAHTLLVHGAIELEEAPRDFNALKEWLTLRPALEGIVWHHPDGRMAKVKRRDFGLPW